MSIPRRPRNGGNHRTNSQPASNTVPDAEEPMTTPPQQIAPDDVIDDWFDAYERAQQRADMAALTVAGINEEIAKGDEAIDLLRDEAARARAEAAKKDADADQIVEAVKGARVRLVKAAETVKRHRDTAAVHGANIQAAMAGGAEDPRLRRDRKAKEARENGQPAPGPLPAPPVAQVGPSVLDIPNPPLGPDPTAPFPHHPRPSVDDLQKTPVAGAES